MTILIDPPAWPAHGTVFSHLVSDTSLAELHAFARANSLSERAFDLDHYDVPAEIYDHLIEAGAVAVDGRELTRRLIRSGLRVPLKERPPKIKNTLLVRWDSLLPHHEELGEHVLEQWSASTRAYHNSAHLLEMLNALDTLYSPGAPPRTAILAAWFHDVVYDGNPGQDERASADYAADTLTPLVSTGVINTQEIEEVTELIKATITHEVSPQLLSTLSAEDFALFLDADMAILAADSARYTRYAQAIRFEYSHFSDEDFRAGRSKVLKGLLARESIYLSPQGQALWEQDARRNIHTELEQLAATAEKNSFSSYTVPGQSEGPE
ncbi:DUF4031 domain-containing protein [uncultured Rothia sp.]|uniref:DUF4031 domain-containing protein n=1 Tax=uncultured Rothia sp. TaxID=316088 RepID=UPI0011A137B9